MTFSEFQPEIAAGLPHADKGVATAAQVVGENKTPSESDASSEKGMGSRSSSVRTGTRLGPTAPPARAARAQPPYRQQLTSRASPLYAGGLGDGRPVALEQQLVGGRRPHVDDQPRRRDDCRRPHPADALPRPGQARGDPHVPQADPHDEGARWDAPRTHRAPRVAATTVPLTPLLLPLYHRSLTPLLLPPLQDVSFKYPETEKWILQKANASLTLGSRAVIIGGNGSGKSTFLKLLIGDLESEEGDAGTMWRHHSLRLSYVAQQSLHHLEDFVQLTPIHYIQERFRTGLDKEVAKLKTLAITPEEEEEMATAGAIRGVVGRKQKGKMVVGNSRAIRAQKGKMVEYLLDECRRRGGWTATPRGSPRPSSRAASRRTSRS